ncbi:porin [Lutibacter sp.]|uniref:porin n=1 Tax=Lutibacter sp. TaxID=1925666 RepID=UPI0025C6F5B2|nr:porin [Lutibacter sp.]MCF6181189.1 OprO/OprP family phosphate-selective porin [Lutibacter sp.]
MITKMKKLVLLGSLSLFVFGLNAQQNDFKSSKTQFMIRGYGHMGYESIKTNGKTESTFNGGTFAPIFLFKHSDRLMFETELEFTINEGSLDIGFEYADIMYVLNDYMTIRGGKFLLPFGTFMERLHPSWVNRMPTKPLGFGHDGIAPGSGVGVELRGAFRLGTSTVNYSVYNTNGPGLKTPDGIDPSEAGMLAFNNLRDNNNSRAFGGRIGILPFSNNSTEFGLSFYSTDKVGNTDSAYENLGANLYAIDFSFVKQIPGLGGIVDIKSQYNKSKVDNMIYTIEETPGVFENLNFNNESHSFYAQLSYRPTMSSNNFISKLELVNRYSELKTPEGSGWGTNKKEYSVGLNYWISWRSLIKLNYQNITGKGGHDVIGDFNESGVYLHWAIGF